MSEDIVGDLRELANEWIDGSELEQVMNRAADEIERLRDGLAVIAESGGSILDPAKWARTVLGRREDQ